MTEEARQLVRFDTAADFGGSENGYRTARRLGITPNSHVDCMIISIAARYDEPLMTLDRQQARIAGLFCVAPSSDYEAAQDPADGL